MSSLKKKQKQVKKKYNSQSRANESNEPEQTDQSCGGGNATEEDSDLASIAQEFLKEEIEASPFLKRKDSSGDGRRFSQASLGSATPLPETEAPFVTSLLGGNQGHSMWKKQTSNALSNFMKYDKKYAQRSGTGKDTLEEESETEPESEFQPKLTTKEKDDTLAVAGRRSSLDRRKSLSMAKSPPINKGSRLQKKAEEKNLRLKIPTTSGGQASHESATTPILTISEISELPIMTDSPSPSIINVIDNLHDIEELETIFSDKEAKEDNMVKVVKQSAKVMESSTSSESTLKEKSDTELRKHSSTIEEKQIPDDRKQSLMDQIEEQDISSFSENKERKKMTKRKSRRRKSRSRRRRRRSSSGSSDKNDATCWYCSHTCSFHKREFQSKNIDLPRETAGHAKSDKEIQVGSQDVRQNHYLFDPSLDIIQYHEKSHWHMEPVQTIFSCRCHNYFKMFSNHALNEVFIAARASDPILNEVMSIQLQMIENLLFSQKKLHQRFCKLLVDSRDEMAKYQRAKVC